MRRGARWEYPRGVDRATTPTFIIRSVFGPHELTTGELVRIHEAERAGQPFIAYRDGAGNLAVQPLGSDERLTFGRDAGNSVVLAWDATVSRTHALLERLGEQWVLSDEGLSRHGTFVNEERIGTRRLDDGDVVRLGATALHFHDPKSMTSPPLVTTMAGDASQIARVTPAQRRVLIALCTPLAAGEVAAVAASNNEIASELVLSIDAVRTHMKALYREFGVSDLPQEKKRAELARRALGSGVVQRRDLEPPS